MEINSIQHGIMQIDLDLLSIQETDCQHFGYFIFIIDSEL